MKCFKMSNWITHRKATPSKTRGIFASVFVSSLSSVSAWIAPAIGFPPTFYGWWEARTSWRSWQHGREGIGLGSRERSPLCASDCCTDRVQYEPACRPALSNGQVPWCTCRQGRYAGLLRRVTQLSVGPWMKIVCKFNVFFNVLWFAHILDFLFVLFREVSTSLQSNHRLVVPFLDGIRMAVLLQQLRPRQPHRVRSIVWLQLNLQQRTGHPQTEHALRQQLIGDAQFLTAKGSGQHHLGRTLGRSVDLHVNGNAGHQIDASRYDLQGNQIAGLDVQQQQIYWKWEFDSGWRISVQHGIYRIYTYILQGTMRWRRGIGRAGGGWGIVVRWAVVRGRRRCVQVVEGWWGIVR